MGDALPCRHDGNTTQDRCDLGAAAAFATRHFDLIMVGREAG